MTDTITVLVTGAASHGIAGTIYALKHNPDNRPVRVVALDIDEDAVGRYLADGFHRVPPPEDAGYADALLDIARREHADALLPQTTREIMALGCCHNVFHEAGVALVLSPAASVAAANDKHLLLERAQGVGVPCPEYRLADSEESFVKAAVELGYPGKKVAVKPRFSGGMRGFRVLTSDTWDVRRFLAEKPSGIETSMEALVKVLRNGDWPELLVCEYLTGPEYTIDVYRGAEGVLVVPRLRERIRNGITFDTRVEMRGDLIDYSTRLAEMLDLRYCFGFQFKLSEDGVPALLESNPRVQGTMVVSALAGFNMVYHAVMEAMGTPPGLLSASVKGGFRFKRYWGGTGIHDGEPTGTI